MSEFLEQDRVYSASDIRLVNNSLQAVLDAVSLMRVAVDDRVKQSFDSLIIQNLVSAITLLSVPQHNYVHDELLDIVRKADTDNKPAKNGRKAKNDDL